MSPSSFALTKGQRSKRQLCKSFMVAIQPLSTHDHLIKPNFCFIMNLAKLTLSFLLQSLHLLGCKNCIRWLIFLSVCKSHVSFYFLLLNRHQRETSLHTWKVKTVPISIILRRYYFYVVFDQFDIPQNFQS